MSYLLVHNQKLSPEGQTSLEDDSHPNQAAIEQSHRPGRPRKLMDSIGITRIIIFALGTVVIAAAIAILSFLWRGAGIATRQANPGLTWQTLVLSGWATRTVTLCAAAIRTVMVVQTGLVGSMIASLLLERGLVSLQSAPFISIARALSVQPYYLLVPGSGYPIRLFRLSCLFIMGLASLLTFASTFFSTILLSDFAEITTIGRTNASPLAFSGDTQDRTMDFWTTAPGPYARFAEYTNSSSRLTGPEYDDTGLALRALLPFQDVSNRTTIRNYTGPATLFDSRVICLAPKMIISNIIEVDSTAVNAVIGTLTFNKSLTSPFTFTFVAGDELDFICNLPSNKVTWSNRPASNISVCIPSTKVAPLNLEAVVVAPVNLPYLVLNATTPAAGGNYGEFLLNNDNGNLSASDVEMSTNGIWSTATLVGNSKTNGAVISITYCVTNPAGGEFNVTATSHMDGPEPTMSWGGTMNPAWRLSSPTANISYNTESIRHQLDATLGNLSLQDRRILALENLPNGLTTGQMNWSQETWGQGNWLSTLNGQFQTRFPTYQIGTSSISTMPSVQMDYQIWASDSQGDWGHVSLFLDVLNTTQSPARALQAWLTTLNQMKYYDSVSRFSVESEATGLVPAGDRSHDAWE
ncbi:hypothetical protein V501_01111 [Pseudogymnoascus sp. VKM F-4519 (FW-2642)]|nr:hypothetical protein V501_01111 [Pseudogymnoascus sp. VKM F-4519 (FW-2642)]